MPSAGRRCRRWRTTRKWARPSRARSTLLDVAPGGQARMPLLVTENYGRGRTVLFATGGSWRWKMWLDHDRQDARHVLAADVALPGDRIRRAGGRRPRRKQVLSDETRGAAPGGSARQGISSRCQCQGARRASSGPDGVGATMELTPVPLEEGVYAGEWTAEKPGIVRGRNHRRPRARKSWAATW